MHIRCPPAARPPPAARRRAPTRRGSLFGRSYLTVLLVGFYLTVFRTTLRHALREARPGPRSPHPRRRPRSPAPRGGRGPDRRRL